MKNKKTPIIMIALILIGTLTLALEIQKVKADLGIIRIKADGSVEGTDKIQRDGDVYTFTANITGKAIVIQRGGITLDGANKILQGLPTRISVGINLTGRSNVMIKNVKIRKFQYGIKLNNSNNCQLYHNMVYDGDEDDVHSKGIYLWNSSYNTLFNNTVKRQVGTSEVYHHGIVLEYSNHNRIFNCTAAENSYPDADDGFGVYLLYSSYNDVFDNEVSSNHDGIVLSHSSNNSIFYNTIKSNSHGEGIGLYYSSYNTIRYNTIESNTKQALVDEYSYNNSWDDGYIGNHWSDYTGQDQNGDNIGDTPHPIDENNQDNYPLWEYNYTSYVHLTVEAGLGGTTDPVPETYPFVEGMEVTVTATPTEEGYIFSQWLLDSSILIYENPVTITMDSNHTLEACFTGGGGGDVPCPTLFAWDGTDYVDLGVIDIHAEEDVVNETLVDKEYVAVNGHKAKFRLREGWPGLNYSHSEIDQVKLYAVVDGERLLCPLLKATHSEQGNVYLRLLMSDDHKTDIYLLETIDVQFAVPYQTNRIQNYVFVIEGRNIIKL